MVVTIKRSRWSTKPEDNQLLDSVSKRMCCLGFCALAAGYDREEILDVATPFGLSNTDRWKQAFPNLNPLGILIDSMVDVNDNPKMSRKEKEPKLIELAAKGGVTLQFVD